MEKVIKLRYIGLQLRIRVLKEKMENLVVTCLQKRKDLITMEVFHFVYELDTGLNYQNGIQHWNDTAHDDDKEDMLDRSAEMHPLTSAQIVL